MTNNTPAPADLLPCPFCAGKALLVLDGGYHAFCRRCCATGRHLCDKEEAITAWNRRAAAITPQPDPRDAEIKRWKEAIDRVNDRCITLINEKDAKDAEIERLREALELVSDARMRRPDGTIADAGWNITKLNEARVRIDAAFAKSGGLVMADVMHAHIDYGYGKADLFGTFTEETVERQFYRAANQCFGIRKSISDFKLLSIAPASLPSPWDKMEGAATVLMHSGDTIVWNADGEKIKSEWD